MIIQFEISLISKPPIYVPAATLRRTYIGGYTFNIKVVEWNQTEWYQTTHQELFS